jgi:hypothetical protein
MNIKELNSFKMSDAVKFHDTLNQKIFNNEKLKPEVRKQLLLIAKDFITELGISDLNVKDITLSGSNAAYSYTKHSDLDLHVLVDMSKLSDDDVYQELFSAKKFLYNENYDIKVHGIPVELYVQDSNEPVVSLGEYSVKNDKWIKLPIKRKANLDQHATRLKYEKLKAVVLNSLKATKSSQVENVTKKIRQYRQAGLDKGGEFSPENLAFKVLRSQGYITKLYDLRNKLHGQELTIETMYKQSFEEDATMQFAAEKTPVISPYSGIKDNQFRGAISEMPDTSGPVGVQPGGWRKYKPKTTEGASGYIPSNAEKDDPRFKTALTVDVKPNSLQKNAKAFGFKVKRSGIPPTLKP